MNKIINLQNALKAVGVNAHIDTFSGRCSDGKLHKGIELSTDYWGGEDNISFVFHPDTHKLVNNFLECPIITEKRSKKR